MLYVYLVVIVAIFNMRSICYDITPLVASGKLH